MRKATRRVQRALVATAAACILLATPVIVYAQEDVTPPQLVSLDFNPKVIDTTSGPQVLTVRMRVTDNLAGASQVCFGITSPSNLQARGGCLHLVSGTAQDGEWEADITFSQFGEAGTWLVRDGWVSVIDIVGNHRGISRDQLIAAGFPTDLEVIANQDVTPPQLVFLDFNPKEIDTTGGPQVVTVRMLVTDDLAGTDQVCFGITSPSNLQARGSCLHLVSGTPQDGEWEANLSFPQLVEAGTWLVRDGWVSVIDKVGNHRGISRNDLIAAGFPTDLEVISSEDVTAPQLVFLDFNPKEIDTTSGPQVVTVRMRVTDAVAGAGQVCFGITSPSNEQARGGCLHLVSGTPQDGEWEADIIFPQFGEAGTWLVRDGWVSVIDLIGNHRGISRNDLIAAGFPTDLQVNTRPRIINTSPARLWVGLKNSDDQGTRFDLRVEVYVNNTLVAEGETRCVTGITRNPSSALEVTVPFGPTSNDAVTAGDQLTFKVFTRIGTTPDGSKCGGHNNAVGLRLYYDAATRASRFGAEITPDPLTESFLHSAGASLFLDASAPVATQPKQKDSGPVNYAGGNAWREVGTWSRQVP